MIRVKAYQSIVFLTVISVGCNNGTSEECDNIERVDLTEFEYVEPRWYRDSLDWIQLEEGQWTDYYLRMNNSIYRVENTPHFSDGYYTDEDEFISSRDFVDHDYCCAQLIYENTADSFFINTLGRFYSKTSKNVYLQDLQEEIYYYNCEKCDSITGIVSFKKEIKINGADARKFEYLDFGYSRDQNNYFYGDSVLTTASIKDSFFYADIPKKIDYFPCIGDNVYRNGEILADAKTFHYDEDDPRNYSAPFLNAVFKELTSNYMPKYVLADKNKKWLLDTESFNSMEEIPYDP